MPMVEIRVRTLVGGNLIDPCSKHLGCPSPDSDHTYSGHGDAGGKLVDPCSKHLGCPSPASDHTFLGHGDAGHGSLRQIQVCDALRCSGPHARYTDVFNEYIALADRPGKSLKFHRDGDRSLQLLVLNEEFLNPVNHRVFERKLRPKPFGRGHVCLGVTHRVAPDHASLVGMCVVWGGDWEADGGRRCVPVGCGTARAGPPIDSGRGPVLIGAAAKAQAIDMPVEMPSRRSWLAARVVTACLGTCVLPAPACGHPIRPVLKHGPRSLTCVRVNG
ncbi:hypothetical protein L6452_08077 [Arctium lappa]|uniref:Uncharacterized protein n=1 Tax=Arctium lappa TaxID=4217 RepID=A0ACB9DG95_ARCLA|nr:hypothetical protein L6452_08077 [Arctium lappa]